MRNNKQYNNYILGLDAILGLRSYFGLGEKKLVIDAGDCFFLLELTAEDPDLLPSIFFPSFGDDEETRPQCKSDSIALSMSPLLFTKASLDTLGSKPIEISEARFPSSTTHSGDPATGSFFAFLLLLLAFNCLCPESSPLSSLQSITTTSETFPELSLFDAVPQSMGRSIIFVPFSGVARFFPFVDMVLTNICLARCESIISRNLSSILT